MFKSDSGIVRLRRHTQSKESEQRDRVNEGTGRNAELLLCEQQISLCQFYCALFELDCGSNTSANTVESTPMYSLPVVDYFHCAVLLYP